MPTQPTDPFRTDVPPTPRRPGEPELQGRSLDEQAFLLSSRRTRLSFQRTRMSADRTRMSIIRTALSLIGFGFTIFQFFRYLRESAGATSIVRAEAARNFSVVLAALGVLLLVLGILGHIRFMLGLRREHDQLVHDGLISTDRYPYSITLLAALLLLIVGILAILSMLHVGPFR